HVVSPRASIFGAKLLASGISQDIVETTILWKGLDEATKNKIVDGMKPETIIKSPKEGTLSLEVEINQTIEKGDLIGIIEYEDNRSYDWKEDEILSPTSGVITFVYKNTDRWNRDINVTKGQKLVVIKNI
ncbi:MAG: hypothetical protein R2772_07345, partial [Chitinophagales bacterium]